MRRAIVGVVLLVNATPGAQTPQGAQTLLQRAVAVGAARSLVWSRGLFCSSAAGNSPSGQPGATRGKPRIRPA